MKFIVAGVVVLVAILAVVFVVVRGDDSTGGDGQATTSPEAWQINPELEQAFVDLGFTCQRQTYSTLYYGESELQLELAERMVTAGIAESEVELCSNEATGVKFGGSLPEDVDSLFGIYSDLDCDPSREEFFGLVTPLDSFLVDGINYTPNQGDDAEMLRGILDDQGIDYTERQLDSQSCES